MLEDAIGLLLLVRSVCKLLVELLHRSDSLLSVIQMDAWNRSDSLVISRSRAANLSLHMATWEAIKLCVYNFSIEVAPYHHRPRNSFVES